jgi:hypothetical protein
VGIANNLAQAGEILITPSAWKLIRNDCNAEPLEFELKDSHRPGRTVAQPEQTLLHFETPPKPAIPEGAENSLRPTSRAPSSTA